jgi:hypothetical protein
VQTSRIKALRPFIRKSYRRYLKYQLDVDVAMQHNLPVSTILLQENSFKPAFTSGLFFNFFQPFCDKTMKTLCHVMLSSCSVAMMISAAIHATDMRDQGQVCLIK